MRKGNASSQWPVAAPEHLGSGTEMPRARSQGEAEEKQARPCGKPLREGGSSGGGSLWELPVPLASPARVIYLHVAALAPGAGWLSSASSSLQTQPTKQAAGGGGEHGGQAQNHVKTPQNCHPPAKPNASTFVGFPPKPPSACQRG